MTNDNNNIVFDLNVQIGITIRTHDRLYIQLVE